jgi:dihydrolipoamide dehydrogenase
LASNGIKLFTGEGRLAGPGRVRVGSEVLEAKSIIISSGNRWVRPDIPGGDMDKVLNSTEFLTQEKLPQKVVFLGGGPWQLELAQFLVAAGKEAVVVEQARNVLPGEDSDISQRLRSIINQGPLKIMNQAKVVSLAAKGAGLEAKLEVKGESQTLLCDQVVYLSREPALENLGLDTVGLNDLSVDEHQKTKVSGIYAVGDITGVDGWSHLSSAQGIVAGENAMGASLKLNPNAVPRVSFTRPQAAAVGLTEEQAEDLDYDVITGEAPMGVSPMAMIQGQSNGVFKVVAEEKYGEVLGIHILAPMATEIIGQAVLAIQMEATLEDLARACFAHPTIGESMADAARDALGWAIYQPK